MTASKSDVNTDGETSLVADGAGVRESRTVSTERPCYGPPVRVLRELVGRRIRQLREERKIPTADLARMVGISRSTLSHMEVGDYFPSFDVLGRLAMVLKVEAFDILTFPGMGPRHDLLDLSRNAPPIVVMEIKERLIEKLDEETARTATREKGQRSK